MSVKSEQFESLDALEGSALDEEQLQEALDAVRERLQIVEARMEQLEQAAVKARREEHLLEGLIALHRGEDVDPTSGTVLRNTILLPSVEDRAEHRGNGVTDSAVALLEEAGRPMHIGELMDALVKHGVEIPGAGTQANLIAHMRRDKRIARPSRGIYGLRALGVEDYEPKKRTRGRRRIKRARRTK